MPELNEYGLEKKTIGFPFTINTSGRVQISGGDESLHGKIIQILFTNPGERVHLPDFGCGLFNMVFEPNDSVFKTTMGFYIREALLRWMEEDINVEYVSVTTEEEKIHVQIEYKKKIDHTTNSVRIKFR